MRRAALLLLALAATAHAQTGLVGPGRYPQFRGISGLPGGGFGVRPDGSLGYQGAMALSTPIAYSLGSGRIALAYSSISRDGSFRFGNSSGADANTDANGTLAGLLGVDAGIGNLTLSYTVLSGLGDQAYGLHLTPKGQRGPLAFGVGIQDLTGEGGTAGEGVPGDSDDSASPYVVGTYALRGDVYLSAGLGTGRFRTLFGSVSAPLVRRARGVVEYDGFSANLLLAYTPALRGTDEFGEERDSPLTLSLGLVRGEYATFAVALHF